MLWLSEPDHLTFLTPLCSHFSELPKTLQWWILWLFLADWLTFLSSLIFITSSLSFYMENVFFYDITKICVWPLSCHDPDSGPMIFPLFYHIWKTFLDTVPQWTFYALITCFPGEPHFVTSALHWLFPQGSQKSMHTLFLPSINPAPSLLASTHPLICSF